MLYRTFSKAQKTMAGVMPLMQFCMYACMLLISWFGARLIVGGSMTTGELTSMFSYAMQILMSLMMVAMVFVMITMAKASAERVAEILDEQPDLHNPANPIHEVKDGAIEFDDVSFSYKGDERKLALKNVSLHINAGQTVGILGGTGSAKSTLVQLIPRLYDTTHGTVKVGGVDVRDYDIEALRDQVAMVLQKNVLFSGTIKENLRWGDENASDEELERVCRLAQADEFIQQMPDKYDTHIEQGGSNVSGGQKQRLCIARALATTPDVLLMDEPTSALDPISTSKIEDLVLELKKGAVTCLMAPSGVGKTTLLRILAGLEQADGGKIGGLEALRKSMVFQEPRLAEELTAAANIQLAIKRRMFGKEKRSSRHLVEEMEELGLSGCENQAVSELSGGMRQRVAVLRAMRMDADFLLLDEPFRGLDAGTKKKTMNYIRRKGKEKTMLLVTHDLEEAEAMGDWICTCSRLDGILEIKRNSKSSTEI